MSISDREERIDKYLLLRGTRPELFEFPDSEFYPLELSREKLIEYEDKTGEKLGIVFENKGFWTVVADLIKKGEHSFRYCRIVYESRESNGCVIVPCLENPDGQIFLGVLENFRHSLRSFAYEFPRGFTNGNLYETVVTEFEEELGISSECIKEIFPLGRISPDSGLASGYADAYAVRFSGETPHGNIGHEGIKSVLWLSENEFENKIGTEIRDSFTQSAYLMYKLHNKN